MSEADLDQVLAIEDSSFACPWRREHFVFEMRSNPWAVSRVVRCGDQVIGYACVWQLHEELKINNVAVRDDYRRRGLGGWIVARLIREAVRNGCTVARLEVRPSNTAAQRLYVALGFVESGRRKDYYQREGEDALLMEADLSRCGDDLGE